MRKGRNGTPRMVTIGHGIVSKVPAPDFGNKAANLAEMASLDIPVPPAFALNVSVCEDYFKSGGQLPGDVPALLKEGIGVLEKATGLEFGSSKRPLLVSVRSGAPVSMPGIMETILNVGLNPDTIRGLISMTGNPRFSWDSYRRLIEAFGTTVYGQERDIYHRISLKFLEQEGIGDEVELDSFSLREMIGEYEHGFFTTLGRKFPENAYEQLELATTAVIRSWESPRAVTFRSMNEMTGVRGTAVAIQAMVFGNMGMHSGAGVAFTRNPWTGKKELLLDFKFGAQGEDVVSGDQSATTQNELKTAMPEVYQNLVSIGNQLERHFKDMQDMEFTIQEERLYILQSRSGKRAPLADLRIAVDLCNEGIISRQDALGITAGIDLEHLVIERINTNDIPVATGLSASGGVICGKIAFTSEDAELLARDGPVILTRDTPSPDDIPGIKAADGLLTSRGARTSHAAVVARQLGKVCVVDCSDLEIDMEHHRCRMTGREFREGDMITLDGTNGAVYAGCAEIIRKPPEDLISVIDEWKRTV
ncbi:MAG TPA: PEP/pyruvate-binding domain-containing protein [Methanoregulaceae archaeon]|nr:PEP/pyruvate-binding domain-containing protein [Methanoregulaceae archaeon]